MSYQKIREILEAIRTFHRLVRHELEEVCTKTENDPLKFLLRSLRRAEKDMDAALQRYKRQGAGSLDEWIEYRPSEELEDLMLTGHLPPHSSPLELVEWKQHVDEALASLYRQLGEQVSDPKAKELFDGLARGIEQRLLNQNGPAREAALASP
jgi:hypothetical protein